MPNATDKTLAEVTTQVVNLLEIGDDIRDDVLADLEDLASELVVDIERAVGKSRFTQARLRALMSQTRATIATAYDGIAKHTQSEILALALEAAKGTAAAVNGAVGAKVLTVALSKDQLAAIAGRVVILGKYPEEWWKSQDARLRDEFARRMRAGLYRGESVDDLVRRVRGTREKGYRDGIITAPKNQAEALVRSSVISVTNEARLSTLDRNRDVIKGVQWVAHLDERTTEICETLDGLQWDLPESGSEYADYVPVGHGFEFPGPTAHWNCRSTQIPITYSWEELAARAATKKIAAKVPTANRLAMDGEPAEDYGAE